MTGDAIAGRYRLEERVGAGGMSEVWRATDLELERTVAVKLLAHEADPARFEREARAVAALSHPNICALYGYGEAAGRPYMVLEHLPGGSLEQRLAGGWPLPDEATLRIATEIAAGLAHAHDRGVVHRDLKPSNILFDAEGRAKIADFGIARLGAATGTTEAGTVLGTAAYISPEQAAGRDATAASDVYAFGVILFRMLTGRLPFQSADALAVAAMHRDDPPPPVSGLRPDAPARLESLAAAALAKSPADRPRDGTALLTEIPAPAWADGAETAATRVMRPGRSQRNRTVTTVAAAAALAAAGVAVAITVTLHAGGATTPLSTSESTTQTRHASTGGSPPPPAETASTAGTTATQATAEPATTTTPAAIPATTAPAPTAAIPATTAPATTAEPTTTTSPPPATSSPATTDTAPVTAPSTTTTATQPG